MKIRGDTNAVSPGPDRDHALLAAFLEATSRLDQRAIQRSVAVSEAPNGFNPEPVDLEPVNLEAEPISLEPEPVSLEAHPTSLDAHLTSADPNVRVAVTPFTFRRANLVRA